MTQSIQVSAVTPALFWFTTWTLFSFLAHYYARSTIQSNDSRSRQEDWVTVLLLTIVQLLVGGVVLKLFISLLNRGFLATWNDSITSDSKSEPLSSTEHVEPCRISMYISHAVATLATNASIAFVNTGSAFTIKAFEPISTAVLTSMLLGTKLQTHVVVSLPMVVTGALGFVWQPSLQSGAAYGLGMAFVSNVLFGVRNINLKLLQRDATTIKAKVELLQTASFIAAAILVVVVVLLIFVTSMPTGFSLATGVISALFHVTYTIISTCIILKYTSVVGHATFNLLKRILVALVFYAIGHTIVSTSNWLMGAVMLLGLAIYVFPKMCPFKGVYDLQSNLLLSAMLNG